MLQNVRCSELSQNKIDTYVPSGSRWTYEDDCVDAAKSSGFWDLNNRLVVLIGDFLLYGVKSHSDLRAYQCPVSSATAKPWVKLGVESVSLAL